MCKQTPRNYRGMNMSAKKTEAQIKAQKAYMSKYVEVKVRMTPERREEIKSHADKYDDGSTTAFINRAIDEAIERDGGRGA